MKVIKALSFVAMCGASYCAVATIALQFPIYETQEMTSRVQHLVFELAVGCFVLMAACWVAARLGIQR